MIAPRAVEGVAERTVNAHLKAGAAFAARSKGGVPHSTDPGSGAVGWASPCTPAVAPRHRLLGALSRQDRPIAID